MAKAKAPIANTAVKIMKAPLSIPATWRYSEYRACKIASCRLICSISASRAMVRTDLDRDMQRRLVGDLKKNSSDRRHKKGVSELICRRALGVASLVWLVASNPGQHTQSQRLAQSRHQASINRLTSYLLWIASFPGDRVREKLQPLCTASTRKCDFLRIT